VKWTVHNRAWVAHWHSRQCSDLSLILRHCPTILGGTLVGPSIRINCSVLTTRDLGDGLGTESRPGYLATLLFNCCFMPNACSDSEPARRDETLIVVCWVSPDRSRPPDSLYSSQVVVFPSECIWRFVPRACSLTADWTRNCLLPHECFFCFVFVFVFKM
jgi:hypothetical protein